MTYWGGACPGRKAGSHSSETSAARYNADDHITPITQESQGRTMRVLFQLILAMALLPFALPQAMAQDENDPTMYVVTYIEVAPAQKDAAACRCEPQGSRRHALRGAAAYGATQPVHDPRDLEGSAGARRPRGGRRQ